LELVELNTKVEKVCAEMFPRLEQLYQTYIAPRLRAGPGGRNAFITEAAPFLYRTVGEKTALELLMRFYLENIRHFKDSPDKHEREAVAALRGVAQTYRGELSDEEKPIYDCYTLAGDMRNTDTFRVCRALAIRNAATGANRDLGFFLSFDELGARIGLASMQAWRVCEQFKNCKILETVEIGQRRGRGVTKPSATVYRWLLEVPAKTIEAEAARLAALNKQSEAQGKEAA
jgi:hypothetical protein